MRRRPAQTGFTIAELIVAVGAVALLTVGVGQIFSSVSNLVRNGSAIAEVEQLARAIEAQMRDDFRALNNFERAEDVFIAIRGRRIGDLNGDGDAMDEGSNYPDGVLKERPIYLTPEDREADLEDGILPYEEGSRAITTRLDEIIFLARSGAGGIYRSYQSTCDHSDPESNADIDCEVCDREVTADTARIYYGHGLRPAPDPDFDPAEAGTEPTPSGPATPRRMYVADGDFGAGPGDVNRFDPTGAIVPTLGGVATGRNEYAGEWVLLRQATLLVGGMAAGDIQPRGSDLSIICNDREYAPYLSDTQTEARFKIRDDNAYPPSAEQWAMSREPNGDPITGSDHNPENGSNVRLLRHGRTDICAQSPETLKRWIEGLDLQSLSGESDSIYTAFARGRWDFTGTGPNIFGVIEEPDHALWGYGQLGQAWHLPVHIGVRSAVCSMLTRFLCETDPPRLNRGDRYTGPGYNPDDPCDTAMDTHAVIASRCSRFEVAWANAGTRWVQRQPPQNPDFDGDGTQDLYYEFGDIVWFDYLFPRRALPVAMSQVAVPSSQDDVTVGGPQTDPEILTSEIDHYQDRNVELGGSPSDRELKILLRRDNDGMLNYSDTAPLQPQGYDWLTSGGAPNEYLAVWPYRVPDLGSPGDATDDTYGSGFKKPDFIRIRMTLHDSEMVLREGKEFEFIFSIDLD